MVAKIIMAMLALSTASCIKTNSVTIGRKTDLERQLMGRLEPLSEEELLAASVRAPGDAPSSSIRELEDRAIAARRRQLFNRDDLQVLAADGCVGEANTGELVTRPCDVSELLDERARLVREENDDRAAVIDWAIEVDPGLTRGDRPQIMRLYYTLRAERAVTGTPVQKEDGGWEPNR